MGLRNGGTVTRSPSSAVGNQSVGRSEVVGLSPRMTGLRSCLSRTQVSSAPCETGGGSEGLGWNGALTFPSSL